MRFASHSFYVLVDNNQALRTGMLRFSRMIILLNDHFGRMSRWRYCFGLNYYRTAYTSRQFKLANPSLFLVLGNSTPILFVVTINVHTTLLYLRSFILRTILNEFLTLFSSLFKNSLVLCIYHAFWRLNDHLTKLSLIFIFL